MQRRTWGAIENGCLRRTLQDRIEGTACVLQFWDSRELPGKMTASRRSTLIQRLHRSGLQHQPVPFPALRPSPLPFPFPSPRSGATHKYNLQIISRLNAQSRNVPRPRRHNVKMFRSHTSNAGFSLSTACRVPCTQIFRALGARAAPPVRGTNTQTLSRSASHRIKCGSSPSACYQRVYFSRIWRYCCDHHAAAQYPLS